MNTEDVDRAGAGPGFERWIAGVAVVGAVAFAGATLLRRPDAPQLPRLDAPAATRAAEASAPIDGRTAELPRARVGARAAGGEPAGRIEVATARGPSVALEFFADAEVFEAMAAIAAAQRAFAADGHVDADGDGRGEYGYLVELMGDVRRPGARSEPRSWSSDPRALRRLFPRTSAPIREGVAIKDCYAFRMFLPGPTGAPLPEAGEGGPTTPLPDPDRAEAAWCCYAWPTSPLYGRPGPVFFVDQAGMVLVADNARGAYVGLGRGPAPEAALRVDSSGGLGDASAATAADGRGRDGQVWRRAVLPPMAKTVVEVRDNAGRLLEDAQVAIVGPWEARGADSAELRAQQAALAGAALPVEYRRDLRTGADGRVEIEGRAISGAVVVVAVARTEVVPSQVRAADGVLHITLPPLPAATLMAPVASNANESAAIATLKNISSAQAQCQASGVIDANDNGAGEYGYFGELTGVVPLRGRHGPTERKMTPPVLSRSFGNLRPPTDGLSVHVVVRSGYCFQMYLPDAFRRGLPEAPTGGAGVVAPDPALSEVLWCCYAWPMSYGESGKRAFFVNQSGDVLACANDLMRYSGLHHGPRPDAVFPPPGDGTIAQALPVAATATDGERWVVVH